MKVVLDELAICPRAVQLIELFDGALPAEQIEDWGRHLEQCSACQAQFEALASQSAPQLSADPGGTSLHLAAARQRLLANPRTGFGETRDSRAIETPTSPPSVAPHAPDAAPQRIGRYSDLQLVGTGGMGVVYRAFDDVLRRAVAIKRLLPHLAASAAARERFVREAQAAAAVVHEHVVPIHSVEEDSDGPFIVMHFVPGENLQERIDRAGPLELRECLRIGIEIAQGLAAAHAGGVVHRDIKPSNILLENGLGRVKITDFGLARVAAAAGLTQKGEAPGTPQYMSAEQARGEEVDCRSDLFSLGSVLYAMSTGRPPFEADTVLGTLRQVADLPARPIRELNPGVPAWLATIIDRLHAKSALQRYQTAEEVAATLRAHLEGVPMGRPKRSRRWWVAAASIGVAGVLAACELTGVTNTLPAIAGLARSPADVQATVSPDTQVKPNVPAMAMQRSELAALDAALQQDPADMRSLLDRARVHAARDELDAAIADYTQVISAAAAGPGRNSALTGRSQIYAQRSDWQAVIDDYCRFIDDNKNDISGVVIWSQLAAVYVTGPESLRNPQRAFELAQAIVGVSPALPAFRNILAAALYRMGQYHDAAEMLEQAARETGGRSQFNRIFLAMTWHQLGAPDNARHCYASALEMEVRNAFYIPLQKLLRAEAEALLAETASPNAAAPPETTLSADPAKAKLRWEVAALDAALQRDPADVRSLLRRAQVHEALGELDQVVADYTQVISVATIVSERGSGLMGRGTTYAQRGQWQAAIDDYSRFFDENSPGGAWSYGRLAAIYLAGPESVRNPQKGLELAQIAVQKRDAHAGFRSILGAALYRVGQYSEAAQTLETAAREKAGYTSFNQFFLAMTWHKLGDVDKAQRCYEVALGLETASGPPQPLQKLLRAEAEALLAETASPDAAAPQSAAETTLSADPAQAKLRSELATLGRALERDPADVRSLLRRSQVHAALGQLDQAVADYTQVISVATVVSERGSALAGRGAIYSERGDFQAAIDDYTRFVDENEDPGRDAWISGRLAVIYVAGPEPVRDPQKALELAQFVLQRPAHAGYRALLGAAFYRVGRYREAAETIEAAAREKDGYTSFSQFFLAMAWHMLGETDKARTCYAAALDHNTASGHPQSLQKLLRAEAEALLAENASPNAAAPPATPK